MMITMLISVLEACGSSKKLGQKTASEILEGKILKRDTCLVDASSFSVIEIHLLAIELMSNQLHVQALGGTRSAFAVHGVYTSFGYVVYPNFAICIRLAL